MRTVHIGQSAKSTSQSGSALIMLVFLASIVAFFIIVSNAALFSREFNNTLDIRKKEYIEDAQKKLELWYFKNARLIDNTVNPITITEEQLFQEAALPRMYGARIAITNLNYQPGSPLAYRNIAIWIPAFGVADTSTFNGAGIFIPNHAQTMYAVVNGQKVEGELVMQTQKVLKDIAKVLEQRFKAKFETDPIHNVRVNYFASINCGAPTTDEIPCTSSFSANGWVPLTDTSLNLWYAAGVNQSMGTDAWGGPIYYNNSTTPANNVDAPYQAVLRAYPPWANSTNPAKTIDVYAMQPLN